MRIGLDISPLGSEHNTRGTGSYTRLLAESLRRYSSQHSVVHFHHSERLPSDVDIYHFPYFDPFLLTLPHVRHSPAVVTVHDLIPIAYPQHFPKGLRGFTKWQIQKHALGRVQAVITDSHASKKDIVRYTSVHADRIHVIPLAPAETYAPVTHEEVLDEINRKYHLPERFFLYVGDINWNKNIPGLIRAYSQLKKNVSTKKKTAFPKLILVGKAFTHTWLPELKLVQSAITSGEVETDVRTIGFVPQQDLAALYTRATCYVQVSYAEGFGLPVLEAMACGCPTIVSGVSSLKEIAGPSISVDPWSIESIAEGLMKAAGNKVPDKREYVAWAKKFTWEKTVAETVRVYESVLK